MRLSLKSVTKDQIVEIGAELRDVLPDPTDSELFDALEDCIGRRGTIVENRLVLVAYEAGIDAAKGCIWYV